MTRILALFALIATFALSACGEDDLRAQADRIAKDVQDRVERARKDFEERRERFGKRIDEILADFKKAVPSPQATSPVVRSRGSNEPETIDRFLTRVLRDVHGYWKTTLTSNDLPAPSVRYLWVPPGGRVLTACGAPAGDDAAFYCPGDDTMYVAQRFAADVYRGVAHGFPGESAGFGRAAGDFAVAYIVAHEYAHNVQQELGIFDNTVSPTAEPYELQADCFAGTWANSAYRQGEVDASDIEEATNAALAVGDFDLGNAQHHGTPQERRDALVAGFESGDPAVCGRYVSAT